MQAQVLTIGPFDQTFTYKVEIAPMEAGIYLGQVVQVPFGRRSILGVVWSLETREDFKGVLKPLETIFPFILPEASRKFIQWMANYTLIPLGSVLKMVLALPIAEFQKALKGKDFINEPSYTFDHDLELSPDQQNSSQTIIQSLNTFRPFVLDGVTGSGKTEVYLAVIEETLKNKGQALVLLPEIALTAQWLERFERRFGCKPIIWHSNVSLKLKRQGWQQVLKGDSVIVVGARSALFLPFQNLQLIVVDEEHDDSYKQQDQNYYQARDMALVRASLAKIPIVLASATPSLETIYNIQKGKYQHLELKGRFAGAVLPTVKCIDMRQQERQQWLSAPLQKAIEECLTDREQVLLFLNRRGYAPLTLCRSCGHRFMCPTCAVWLVQHKNRHNLQLECHHCDFHQPLPRKCPVCEKEDNFVACGPGVERVEEEVKSKFPETRVLVVTSDHLATAQAVDNMITAIQNQEVDIIIGTQILAKGHHFPSLTLVGVIDADLGLSGGDLRASERTYQLLHQVAGRAGREQKKGQVLLQTYHPEHPLFKAIQHYKRDEFYSCELQERQVQHFPPFGYLSAVILSGLDAPAVERYAHLLARSAPLIPDITVLGPVPAPIARLKGRYRWRFLIKSSQPMILQPFLKKWLSQPNLKKSAGTIRITIDIDPYSFL
jgi:primosomal protein N' (replication factor Y)